MNRARLPLSILLLGLAMPAWADGIRQVPFATLAPTLNAVIDFDGFDAGPEPGQEMSRLVVGAGAMVGGGLKGQSHKIVDMPTAAGGGQHYVPSENLHPSTPLALSSGHSFVIAAHRGFGSDAAFPVGPDGAAARSGRGEGVLSVIFDDDQDAVGFKLHADYNDPLGARPRPGLAVVVFHDRAGAIIDRHSIRLHHGVMPLAFQTDKTGIAAITISNIDPGGIAIDDIMFRRAALTG